MPQKVRVVQRYVFPAFLLGKERVLDEEMSDTAVEFHHIEPSDCV